MIIHATTLLGDRTNWSGKQYVLRTFKMDITFDIIIPLMGIYPKEMNKQRYR